jgi:outer membrane protein X
MKKLMMIACMMLFSTAMFAEKGDMFVGGGFSYGIGSDYKNFGIGVKGQYEILTNFRADAQVDHFFKHDGWSLSDININLEYAFPVSDAINVYPLAGLAFVGFSENNFGFMSHAKVGFNIGAGAELPVNDKWKVFFDAKYQVISDAGRFIPTLGILIAL